MRRRCRFRDGLVCVLAAGLGAVPRAAPAEPPAAAVAGPADPLAGLLGTEVRDIDLGSALRLAGVENPNILLARQRVVEAVALRQLAAAQLLPSLNYGASFDDHNGNLQQSSGNILKVDRSALYLGAGAKAIAAGTVSIPGVSYNLNLSQTVYNILISRQVVAQRRFDSRAVENEMLRQVAVAYAELLRAEGRRSLARKIYDEAREVERVTGDYVKVGLGRQADADRATTERLNLEAELRGAEGETLLASARLSQLLNLDPTLQLRAVETQLVPTPVVPDPIPLCELLAIALLQRPEMNERRAGVQAALLSLNGTRVLPFSPNVILGYSAGNEGGGSNLVHQIPGTDAFARGDPRFGLFAARQDFDVIAYWALQNLGVGNAALIREARSRLGVADMRLLQTMDQVRVEVARAHVRTHTRFAQIETAETAVREAGDAFAEDLRRIRGGVGLPIELLNSLRLLRRGRYDYLDAIITYNEAQFDLYVALGQPPADMLARPVPTGK